VGSIVTPLGFSFDPQGDQMPTRKKPTPKTKTKPAEPAMPDQPEKVAEPVVPDQPVDEDRAITHEDFVRMQKRNQ